MNGTTAAGLSVATETATTPAGSPAAVAAFEGDLDLATLGSFEDAVGAAGENALVVDLSEVRFIDSSGIHALMRARSARTERRLGIQIVITPGSAVDRVLEISGLSDELGQKADREDALAALDDRAGP